MEKDSSPEDKALAPRDLWLSRCIDIFYLENTGKPMIDRFQGQSWPTIVGLSGTALMLWAGQGKLRIFFITLLPLAVHSKGTPRNRLVENYQPSSVRKKSRDGYFDAE